MVSPARPSVTIGRGEQGLDFRAGQVVNLPSHELLIRHRQHSLYKRAPPWLLQRHVTEERPNGGQSDIARTRRHASHLLDMIEEGANQWGIKILQGTSGMAVSSAGPGRTGAVAEMFRDS